jgi:HEAT repeat protein
MLCTGGVHADTVADVLHRLPHMDAAKRVRAIYELAETGDRRAAPALIRQLDCDDSRVRVAAVVGLATLKEPYPLGPLIRALSDATLSQAAAYSCALGNLGDAATPALLKALKSPRTAVRAAAAGAFGYFAEPRAVGALVPLLSDPDRDVRAAAAQGLAKTGSLAAAEAVGRELAVHPDPQDGVWWQLHKFGAAGTRVLMRLLKHADERVRLNAASALSWSYPPPDVAVWLNLLKSDPSSEVRQVALAALGRTKSQAVTGVLVAAFDDPDTKVRAAAVRAIGDVGAQCAVEELLRLVGDTDKEVRAAAIGALGGVNDHRVDPIVERALYDDHAAVRTAATIAVCLRGPERFAVIERALQSKNNDAIESAAHALEILGAGGCKPTPRLILTPTLMRLVVGLLSHTNAELRNTAVRCLEESGGSSHAAAIAPLLRDQDGSVCRAAIEVLGTWQYAPARNELVRILFGERDTVVPGSEAGLPPGSMRGRLLDRTRNAAARALVHRGDKSILPMFIESVANNDSDSHEARSLLSSFEGDATERALLRAIAREKRPLARLTLENCLRRARWSAKPPR